MSSRPGNPSMGAIGTWPRDIAPAVIIVIVLSRVVSWRLNSAHGYWLALTCFGLSAVVFSIDLVARLEDRFKPAEPVAAAGYSLARNVGLESAAPAPFAVAGFAPMSTPMSTPESSPQLARPPAVLAKPLPRLSSKAVRGIRTMPLSVTVAKLGNADDENEDAFAFEVRRGRIVVADGASSSFASRDWSRALCDEFLSDRDAIESHESFASTVTRAVDRWTSAVTPTGEVAWYAQQGLARGAFATLLVCDIAMVDRKERWRAATVGDSCLAQLRKGADGWSVVTSFPMALGEKFTSYPDLLQTNSPGTITGLRWAEGDLKSGDVLLLATDAVSEWLLGPHSAVAAGLLAEGSPDQMIAAFAHLRQSSEMVNDDCTLVRLVSGQQALR
ncbi:MAG: hypothetical protein JWR83_213 [Aeromicrobium sp.]|nr:hypothetical protein [Aeromicrobium sp.]